MKERTIHRLDTDVLIIGGGSAGMWAAKRVKEENENIDVLIVDKSASDWGGLMSMAGGDFDAVTPKDNLDDWVKDLVYYYDGLCDQEISRAFRSGVWTTSSFAWPSKRAPAAMR